MRLTRCRHHVLGAVLIAAGSAAAAIPPPMVTDTRDPARQAAFCAAFLTVDSRSGRIGDRRRGTAALAAWRAELRRLRPSDAGAFLASAVPITDNESPDSHREADTYCEAHAPARGRR